MQAFIAVVGTANGVSETIVKCPNRNIAVVHLFLGNATRNGVPSLAVPIMITMNDAGVDRAISTFETSAATLCEISQ